MHHGYKPRNWLNLWAEFVFWCIILGLVIKSQNDWCQVERWAASKLQCVAIANFSNCRLFLFLIMAAEFSD